MANGETRFRAGTIVVALALTGSAGIACGQGGVSAKQPALSKTPVQVSPALFHPELAVSLTIDTSVTAGVGEIAMHGQVCNRGNRDYVLPQQDGYAKVESEYMVYTTHPPHSYAQEANLVFPGHQGIGHTLKVGQCVAHPLTLKVPNVSRWLHKGTFTKPLAGERLAQKQIVFKLNRGYGTIHPDSTFPAGEDGDPTNNSAVLEVQYMEKTP